HAELGYRLTGSSDLYADDGRKPSASINFITAHDGFTLDYLVSYNEKHNEANGEENRDGANDNESWNCGVEGPTDDPAVIELPEDDWAAGWLRCFGMRLGEQLGEVDERGELIVDDVLLILLNGHHEPLPFTLPAARDGEGWELVVDTSRPELCAGKSQLDSG